MNSIKEITVFSIGNANELKTWSNVPYFFTKSIEDKNIKVNRINLEENHFLNILYKYSIYLFFKLINKNSNHSYFRSRLNYYLTNRKIKASIKKFDKADVLLFLTYSFSASNQKNKKIVLFSDWSYLYYINNFLKREAIWFEQKTLHFEQQHINEANTVISLFPKSLEFNLQHYNNKQQYYLGNVINGNYALNKEVLVAQKQKSNQLLFIGNKKYIQGAIDLIKAFEQLQTRAELHIIGLNENEVGIKTNNLFYHGYLNKGITCENELYYKLLTEAKVIVNTNPDWGAFSAMTEAMYYFTPVITSPYPEFTETYGTEINFGFYVNHNATEELVLKLENVLNNSPESQQKLMDNAHEQVKGYSWSSYTDKVLTLISE